MHNHKHRVCPIERAGKLQGRFRKITQNPQRILKPYLKEGMAVLDVGCGPGYFSIPAAAMVGDSGKVIAVDLQQGMLDKLETFLQNNSLKNRIHMQRCSAENTGVSEPVDVVLVIFVAHELSNQQMFFQEMKSIIKPGGILYLAEPMFRVTKQEFNDTVIQAQQAGFKQISSPFLFLARAGVFTV